MRTTFLFLVLSLATTAYAQSGRGASNRGGNGVGRRPPYGSLPMPSAGMSVAALLAALAIGKKLKNK